MTGKTHRILIAALAFAGLALWIPAARSLHRDGLLDAPRNPGALGGSPYGRTLGLAIQGPIDLFWHLGEDDDDDHGDGTTDDAGRLQSVAHLPRPIGNARLSLQDLGDAANRRTNPYGAGEAHRRHLLLQAQRKLEIAYWLDPTSYANYNSLHLFLIISDLGTRELAFDRALEMADRTAAAAERESVNPEPWLTAAAAYGNKLEIKLSGHPVAPPDPASFRADVLAMERALDQYAKLRDRKIEDGSWEMIPKTRRDTMEIRFSESARLLEAQKTILSRLENSIAKNGATH